MQHSQCAIWDAITRSNIRGHGEDKKAPEGAFLHVLNWLKNRKSRQKKLLRGYIQKTGDRNYLLSGSLR